MQTLAADQAALQMLPMNLGMPCKLLWLMLSHQFCFNFAILVMQLHPACREIDVHIVAPQPLHAEHERHADISNNEGDLAHNTRAQLYMNLARNFARHLAPIWERNFGGLDCYYRQV